MSIKKEQIDWRREQIIRLRSTGLSYREIAQKLQISKTVIGEDMLYLRAQSKETIKKYVTEHLPEQFNVCLVALDSIIKHASEIIETTDDNGEKMQAMELFKDTHIEKLDLLSNSTTIDSALQFIKSRQEQKQEEEQQEHVTE